MKFDKKTLKHWWQRFRFKYRISVVNELKFDEIFAVNISPLSLVVIGFSVLVITILLISSLIVATPLKNMLPGYLDVRARRDIVASAIALDTLERKSELYDRYLLTLKKVMAGDIKVDSVNTVEKLDNVTAEMAQASDTELEFRKKYEEGSYQSIVKTDGFFGGKNTGSVKTSLFSRPASGTIIKRTDREMTEPGVLIATEASTPITAVRDGRILSIATNTEGLGTIVVQHEEGFVSCYSGCGKINILVGERVKEGQTIALSSKSDQQPVRFTLWQNGTNINPETLIAF